MASGTVARVGPARATVRRLPQLDPMLILASVAAAAILGLLGATLWISFFFRESALTTVGNLENYAALYTDPFALRAAANTAQLAVVTLVVAFALGLPIAWLVERSDVGKKDALNAAMVAGLLIPGFFTAMGWIFLVHPRIGIINVWLQDVFGFQSGPINVANPVGMGFIVGLGLSSLVYVLTASSLRAMDPSLEEAAQISGANFRVTLRRVTLPLIWPALLASGLYVFTIGIAAFDVPLVIGLSNQVYTFSTFVLVKTQPLGGGAVPDYGVPAAFSTFMVALGILITWWYTRALARARRFQVVRGRSYRPKLVALGPWRPAAWLYLALYMLATRIMPFLLLLWVALQPFFRAPSLDALQFMSLKHFTDLDWNGFLRALQNSAVLMVVAPTLALAMSLVSSWIVLRSRYRFRLLYDYVAFLPHGIPASVFGLTAVYIALRVRGPIDLYGTLALLAIVLALSQLSFGSRITNNALIQISDELEEAAYVAGARRFDTIRAITLPLLRPALIYAWLWMALFAFRELTLATMLFGKGNLTLAFFIWGTWNTNSFGEASAMVVVTSLLMVPLVLLYLRIGGLRRLGF